MSQLAVHATVVRIYAEALRSSFGPLVHEKQPVSEVARLLLGLADATASCAEAIAESQQHLEALAREMGLPPPPTKLRVIEGGQR